MTDCFHIALPVLGTEQSRNRSPPCTSHREAGNCAFDDAHFSPSQSKFWSLPPWNTSKQPRHLFLSAACGFNKHPLGKRLCLSYRRTRSTELGSFLSCWGACGAGSNPSSELLCPLKHQHRATVISTKLPVLLSVIALEQDSAGGLHTPLIVS